MIEKLYLDYGYDMPPVKMNQQRMMSRYSGGAGDGYGADYSTMGPMGLFINLEAD